VFRGRGKGKYRHGAGFRAEILRAKRRPDEPLTKMALGDPGNVNDAQGIMRVGSCGRHVAMMTRQERIPASLLPHDARMLSDRSPPGALSQLRTPPRPG